jgi:hypothetical protein
MITSDYLKTLSARQTFKVATTLGTNLLVLVTVLSGCGGGGGGGGSTPTPAPSQTPITVPTPVVTPVPSSTPSPTPTGDAKERSISANFLPNYIPAEPKRYLHWADNKNLKVFIHGGVVNVVDKVPSANISASRAATEVRTSLDAWTTASSSDFRFTLVASADEADIEVYFVDELRRLNGSVATGVGLASYSFTYPNSGDTSRGLLDNAVVQILASQPDVNMPDTIAHEIGHALGIEEHSEDSNDLLFATTLPPTNITQRDQNTLFFLYYSPAANPGQSRSSGRESSGHRSEIVCGVN